jgi:hypothetical protein
MPRSRYVGLTVLALVLAATVIQTGWSEGDKADKRAEKSPEGNSLKGGEVGKDDWPRTVYSLSELGDDPNLCQWIAETLPRVIEPGNWTEEGAEGKGKGVLSYYAPAKVMVVYHTPAVQTKVRAFLDDLKKSLPPENAKVAGKPKNRAGDAGGVVPSKYEEPGPVKAAAALSLPKSSYPVPARSPQPKHLFHFIIRYEGEGIIDDTVAGVLKELYGAKQAAKEDAEGKSCPACPTPPARLSHVP